MAEYIERDAALRDWPLCDEPADAYQYIRSYPVADVRPVVRASWKRIDFKPCGHDYECSLCRWKNDMATKYCPNCGADMREEELEDS